MVSHGGQLKSVTLEDVAREARVSASTLFTLPCVLGMSCVWLSQPIADALAGTVGLAFLIVEIRQLTRMGAPRPDLHSFSAP